MHKFLKDFKLSHRLRFPLDSLSLRAVNNFHCVVLVFAVANSAWHHAIHYLTGRATAKSFQKNVLVNSLHAQLFGRAEVARDSDFAGTGAPVHGSLLIGNVELVLKRKTLLLLFLNRWIKVIKRL